MLTSKLGSAILFLPSKLGKWLSRTHKLYIKYLNAGGNNFINKEEILEKSRRENKNQDIYEQEIIRAGRNVGATLATVLATVFYVIQIFTGAGMNYDLYAVVFTIPAGTFIVKAIRLKRKHEILVSAFYILFILFLSFAHIYNLCTAI